MSYAHKVKHYRSQVHVSFSTASCYSYAIVLPQVSKIQIGSTSNRNLVRKKQSPSSHLPVGMENVCDTVHNNVRTYPTLPSHVSRFFASSGISTVGHHASIQLQSPGAIHSGSAIRNVCNMSLNPNANGHSFNCGVGQVARQFSTGHYYNPSMVRTQRPHPRFVHTPESTQNVWGSHPEANFELSKGATAVFPLPTKRPLGQLWSGDSYSVGQNNFTQQAASSSFHRKVQNRNNTYISDNPREMVRSTLLSFSLESFMTRFLTFSFLVRTT